VGRLSGAETIPFDALGTSVAMDADVMIVGSPAADSGAGAAYAFRRSGAFWTQQARLTIPGGGTLDALGTSVAVSGDVAVLGAPGADGATAGSGVAIVYEFDGALWVPLQTLSAIDGQGQDFFGQAVSISGDTILIGAYGDDDQGSLSGSVYVFMRAGATWLFQQKITASDAAAGDQFGWSVSIDGATAVVGANLDDEAGADRGSAYVYQRGGTVWSQATKLSASNAAAGDFFGQSVAVSGNAIVVGAPAEDGAEADSGSAYVFRNGVSGWVAEDVLTPTDGEALDNFGGAVALDGDLAVVGARGEDETGNRAGAAYAFGNNAGTWGQIIKLTASDAAEDDFFGVSVGASDGRAAVGAPFNDTDGMNAGAAYAFVVTGQDCNGNLTPDECEIASGAETDADVDGIPDACQGPSCTCETDDVAGVDVFDLLAYLDGWFAGAGEADIDGAAGVDVFDLLFFLDCWFPASAGGPCP
jgi:hypothetical protein